MYLDSDKQVYLVYFKLNETKKPEEVHYEINQVKILERISCEPGNQYFYKTENRYLDNVKDIETFPSYYRINFKNGTSKVYHAKQLKLEVNKLTEQNSLFTYLKLLAEYVGLEIEDKNLSIDSYKYAALNQQEQENLDEENSSPNKINLLLKSYKNAEELDYFIFKNSIFNLLLDKEVKTTFKKLNRLIFPFGINLSQNEAVKNCFNSPVSFVQGPPGTGKTQTILNMVANAIINNKTVAVVSSNNAALTNIKKKLDKEGFGFICAFLGNDHNKQNFIDSQTLAIPKFEFKRQYTEVLTKYDQTYSEVLRYLKIERRYKIIDTDINDYQKSIEFIKEHIYVDENEFPFKNAKISSNVGKLLDYLDKIKERRDELSFWDKIKIKYKYKVKKMNFLEGDIELVYFKFKYFIHKFKYEKLLEEKEKLEEQLQAVNRQKIFDELKELSLDILKFKFAQKYLNRKTKTIFNKATLRKQSFEFLEEYPLILSTTYSLQSCLGYQTMYDYVIFDEASQVDICTGYLTTFNAKNIVVVGDLKQLPNVVDSKNTSLTDNIFEEFGPINGFDDKEIFRYKSNSFLSSAMLAFKHLNPPNTLLREHYRCVPSIIQFCNENFYEGELIVCTKDETESSLYLYQTVKGDHADIRINEREIEVIAKEIVPNHNLLAIQDEVGIISPYRDQVNLLQKYFKDTNFKIDTVDKFQGQERDVIIFSTVRNEINEFVSDPKRLNVVVSRAKKKLILVTNGNDNDYNSNIAKLVNYIKDNLGYVTKSKLISVFDILYKQYNNEKEDFLKDIKRLSIYLSEDIYRIYLEKLLKMNDLNNFKIAMQTPLHELISTKENLNKEEQDFLNTHMSALDFLILDNEDNVVLAIDVDGKNFHKTPLQKYRDRIKMNILNNANINCIRIKTSDIDRDEEIITILKKYIANLDNRF